MRGNYHLGLLEMIWTWWVHGNSAYLLAVKWQWIQCIVIIHQPEVPWRNLGWLCLALDDPSPTVFSGKLGFDLKRTPWCSVVLDGGLPCDMPECKYCNTMSVQSRGRLQLKYVFAFHVPLDSNPTQPNLAKTKTNMLYFVYTPCHTGRTLLTRTKRRRIRTTTTTTTTTTTRFLCIPKYLPSSAVTGLQRLPSNWDCWVVPLPQRLKHRMSFYISK